MDPKDLLFHSPLADEGLPLFKSQRELAHALVETPGGGFEGKDPENVRIFISQVLKPGVQTGSRPMSANLRRALPALISARIKDADRASQEADRILKAIERFNDPDSYVTPVDDLEEWSALVQASIDPRRKNVVIITEQPAETQSTKKANLLTMELLRRAIKGSDHYQEDARYEFFITQEREAQDSLLGITETLANDRGISFDDATSLVNDAIDGERINIYFLKNAPPLASPTCYFDPLLPRETLGFTLFYHPEGKVSVARINDHYIDKWRTEFYWPIFGKNEFGKNEKAWEIVPIGRTRPIAERNTKLSALA